LSLEFFASPHNIDPEFRIFLESACNQLCDWLATSGEEGPLPESFTLPQVSPEINGLSREELLDDLKILMKGAYRPSHPGALGHLDPPALTSSIVGDLICAGINNNLLAEELSPSLSILERKLCSWFATRIGLPDGSGGVAASGGTLSNLMALVIARQHAELHTNSNAVLLASDDAHVSLEKALSVMGLSNESLQKVDTDKNGMMSLDALYISLERIRSQGKKCFAVVATAGTTLRGAVDPIFEISKICKQENIWLHVDGAIGGVFSLSQKTSKLVKGISLADSISINPQKLLGIAKTSSLLIVSDRSKLSSAFSTGLPYTEPSSDCDEYHGGEIGIQGTRPAEALKLWMGLRQLGQKGLEQLLLESIERREYLQSKIDINKFNIISGPLHLLALSPKGLTKSKVNEWSITTRKELLSKNFMLSRPIHNSIHYLKVVLGNPNTQLKDLDVLSELLNQSLC